MVRLSSTLECVPELLNLLWGQLLAPAHNAQHLFALDLALSFASRLRFHALAIGLGVETAVLILAEGVSPKSHTGLETACAAILGWPSLIQHRNGGAREAFERRAALL